MFYKTIYLLALLCITYNPMHATGLTHTNDRDLLHFRFPAPTMPTPDQLPETPNNHSLIPDEQEACDTDCLPLCFVFTGECAGTITGYSNLGAAIGIVSGLMYEFRQCLSE